ncbi:MAG: PASTA domain-containing protein [Terriglobales bacterium]
MSYVTNLGSQTALQSAHPDMRAFFRFVLLGLILVIVALASALTAMRVAIHGREVAVPKLVGLTPNQAERLALQNGLLIDVANRFYSSDIPEGRILSQTPDPGTKVRRGWRVRLAESLGKQQVVIPNVVGDSERSAEINLRRRGLEPGTVAFVNLPGQPQDQVIAQNPPAGAEGIASPKVNLLLAAPDEPAAYVMPNLVGHSLADAQRILQGAGMKIGTLHTVAVDPQLPNPPAPGTVLRQSIAAGQKVIAGTSLDFDVSK